MRTWFVVGYLIVVDAVLFRNDPPAVERNEALHKRLCDALLDPRADAGEVPDELITVVAEAMKLLPKTNDELENDVEEVGGDEENRFGEPRYITKEIFSFLPSKRAAEHLPILIGIDEKCRRAHGHRGDDLPPLLQAMHFSSARSPNAIGSDDLVTFLLENGANIDVKGRHGRTALHSVPWDYRMRSQSEQAVQTMDYLISKGADCNSKDSNGRTVLHDVAERNYNAITLARVLLGLRGPVRLQARKLPPMKGFYESRNGVASVASVRPNTDVDAVDASGRTPLHLAAGNGNYKMAELLIHANANVNAKDDQQQTPLYHAVLALNDNVERHSGRPGYDLRSHATIDDAARTVDRLFKKGANPYVVPPTHTSKAIVAADHSHNHMLRSILGPWLRKLGKHCCCKHISADAKIYADCSAMNAITTPGPFARRVPPGTSWIDRQISKFMDPQPEWDSVPDMDESGYYCCKRVRSECDTDFDWNEVVAPLDEMCSGWEGML